MYLFYIEYQYINTTMTLLTSNWSKPKWFGETEQLMLVLCKRSFKQHFYQLFYFCCKFKRFFACILERGSLKALLLRDKIYKRTNETMYNKEMIKWVERRKLCTNLKIITFTCLCNAFTIPRTKFWKREWKTSLTNNFFTERKIRKNMNMNKVKR